MVGLVHRLMHLVDLCTIKTSLLMLLISEDILRLVSGLLHGLCRLLRNSRKIEILDYFLKNQSVVRLIDSY